MATFAKRLQGLRVDNDWTQQELAAKLGVSKSTIGMYESGNRSPDNDALILIADLFNVSTDYLLGRTSEKTLPRLSTNESPLSGESQTTFSATLAFGVSRHSLHS